VQSTFLYALSALRRGVVPLSEATWLVTIAQNVCHNRWNADRRRRTLELAGDPLELEEPHAHGAPDGLGREALARALARLPETQRRAILLREWQGLSYAEIEADLGMSKAAVETLIFRARRTLAEELRHEVETPVTRRVGLRGLDLASILSSLKSLLTGSGVAAKIVAGVAAVSVAAGVVGVRELERTKPAGPSGRHEAPGRVTPFRPALTLAGAPLSVGGAVGAASRGRAAASGHVAPGAPGTSSSPAGDPAPGSTPPTSDAPQAGPGEAGAPGQDVQQPSAPGGSSPGAVLGTSPLLPSAGDGGASAAGAAVDTVASVVQDPVATVTSVVQDPVGTVTGATADVVDTVGAVGDTLDGVVQQVPVTSPTTPVPSAPPLPETSPVVPKLLP
jgi:RNA polymerase sigma factor (sigma-70 family)